jgi:hypothetical protein
MRSLTVYIHEECVALLMFSIKTNVFVHIESHDILIEMSSQVRGVVAKQEPEHVP